jgi:hypothetical protein
MVAVVLEGSAGLARSVALILGSLKTPVVLAGPVERDLAETVGEIANAAGKARHVVGEARARGTWETAVAKANEVFGAPTLLVAPSTDVDLEAFARAHGLRVLVAAGEEDLAVARRLVDGL